MAYHGYINFMCGHLSLFPNPTILEIGVDKGQTMFPVVNFLTRLCTDNDRNYLYTGIDVLFRDHVIIGANHINYANWNLDNQITQHTAGLISLKEQNSLEALPELNDTGIKYVLALVDGDHNYYTVKKELEFVSQMISPKYGIIICDDYNGPGGLQDEYFSELDKFYKGTGGNENVNNLVKREDCDFGDKVGVKYAVDEFIEENDEWSLNNTYHTDEPVLLYKPEFINFENGKINYIGVTGNE